MNESDRDQAARYLALAARRARSNDAVTAALVGIGHAVLALLDGDPAPMSTGDSPSSPGGTVAELGERRAS